MASEGTPFRAKVCMVGDPAVGKTALVRRLAHDAFTETYDSTLRVDVTRKDLSVPTPGSSARLRLALWDLMGEPDVVSVFGQMYFEGAAGVVIVCDLTRYQSFRSLAHWLQAIGQYVGDVPKVMAVNKYDLKDETMVLVAEEDAKRLAGGLGMRCVMTSAKTGEGVDTLFMTLGLLMLDWPRLLPPTPPLD